MASPKSRTTFAVLLAGLAGILVLALPAAASARDRNHDRIPDRWEKRHHLSLDVNQAHRDQDHDGLNNRQEFRAGTDPRDADTDNDGAEDGDELAGTIVSFDGTTLVIDRFGAGRVSGRVTDRTEIKCEREDGGNRGPGATPREDRGDDEGACTAADLRPDAVVAEAELNDAGTLFKEVELA